MTFPLPTDTAHVRLESRQYRILRFDLGEGVPRAAIKVGLVVFGPWLLACYLIGVQQLGARGVGLWLIPPTLLTWRACSRDASGRLRMAAWSDQLAWLLRQHRPIVNGDTASPATPRPMHGAVTFLVLDDDTVTHDQVLLNLPQSVPTALTSPAEEPLP